MKSQLTSYDLHAISKEFQILQNSYFDKFYQLTKDEFLIRFNTKDGKKNIFIKNGKYIYLTEKEFQKENPTNFAMTIRKHLNNGKVIAIYQKEFERILVFEIQKAKKYFLIVELFSDGNIILADEEKIIANLITQEWKHRTIKTGIEYKFPPLRENPKNLQYKTFKEILQNSKKDLVRTLVSEINLSGEYAEEICLMVEIKKEEKIENLKEEDFKKLFQNLEDLFKREQTPNIVLKEEKYIDLLPIKLNLYNNFQIKIYGNFSNAVEEYFSQIEKEKNVDLEKIEIERLIRQLNQQENALNQVEKEINESVKIAELIYINYNKIEEMLNFAKQYFSLKTKKEKIEFLNTKNIEFIEKERLISFELNGVNLKLNANKTVQENAEIYYNSIKKIKEKILGIKRAIEETKRKIEEIKKEKKIEIKKEEPKKQFWFEKYKWTFSSEGNLIIGGRDAKTNEEIVKKHLKEKDRYCHADIYGGSSIVVKRDIKFSLTEKTKNFTIKTIPNEISENTLKQGCEFAIIHSKAWSSKFPFFSAYWVLPEQVSKTPESGEFLPKGAFMIRGKRNYVSAKLECGICKIEIDGIEKIVCFPSSTIKSFSEDYIILGIGEKSKDEISKEIAKKFDCSIEEVQRILPSGEFSILEEKLKDKL